MSKKKTSKIRLFCEVSSIRGMQKIIKARTRFLRGLWIVFICIMTTGLFVTSMFLILDYLNYDTAWHTSTKLDIRPEFPSITVCGHNPFAVHSDKYWNSGQIMSPKVFGKKLVNASFEGLQKSDDRLVMLSLFEDINTYYSNLAPNESTLLGHDQAMMRYCIVTNHGFTTLSENCSDPERIKLIVRRFSHSYFLNCYTIEGEKWNSTNDIEAVALLVAITPTREVKGVKDMFAFDMLNRGEGLKVTIHQRGSFPDVLRHGINIEPGKMNEITYDTTEWQRYSTPKVRCMDGQGAIMDMGHAFNYTLQQCLETVLQQRMIEDCGCINTAWPRSQQPTDSLPYCLRLEKDLSVLSKRIECAEKVMMDARALKKSAENAQCLPRCTLHTYSLHTSVTKWNPSSTKFQILASRYRAIEGYLTFTYNNPVLELLTAPQTRELAVKKAKIRTTLLREISTLNNTMLDNLLSADRFSFIKLQRRSFDMTVKVEKLVFDLNILASRIGGLCSLCIGLTAAFVIEIVEFVYLYFRLGEAGGPQAENLVEKPPEEKKRHCTANPAAVARSGGGSTSRRGHLFTYNDEDESLTYGRYGIGNNHFSESPWLKMNAENAKCAHCGRNYADNTPISSV